jgi:HD superfamily phosphohydrolase
MATKIFRDPLYNYVGISLPKDEWILDLLESPEIQRLRRIHQLGVSNFTYPGADHSRLSHSLGVLYLMGIAWDHIENTGQSDPQIDRARHPLLAAALLHDVGHGPFSHVFEKCLGINHEEWTLKIINSSATRVHEVLGTYDIPHAAITSLIDEHNHDRPAWQKSLLSSQLDVDRLDYLRRDSLFTGAGYGHFDWFRILHTFQIHGPADGYRDLIWEEKAKFAIEEYIFARYYMYENVYFHRTTRGFELLLQAMWKRARDLNSKGINSQLLKPIKSFWAAKSPTIDQYLALEEYVVLQQMQNWKSSKDEVLRDLSRRFLNRDRFVGITAPLSSAVLKSISDDELKRHLLRWDRGLRAMVRKEGIKESKYYVLRDTVEEKLYKAKGGPYVPEKETGEQTPTNTIWILPDNSTEPVEITQVLTRLKAVTEKPGSMVRYYVPKTLESKATEILNRA